MIRSAAATALSAVAAGLSVGSRLTDRAARLLRPEPPGSDGPADDGRTRGGRPALGARRQARTDSAEGRAAAARRGAVREPPTEPVPDVDSHQRTHETHVEELAARTAAEVVAVVPELSTDELGRLYEHEAANKKRKTVLTAIERAADPHTQPPGHAEPLPEAGGVPVGGGPPV